MRYRFTSLTLGLSLGTCILNANLSGQTVPHEPAAHADAMKTQASPAGRPSIGLALEGGGALGLAHVGVYLWMREHHVPIDRIAGTSMGALVGSLIASGHSPEEIQQLIAGSSFEEVFALRSSLSHLSFRRREDRDDLPQAFTVGLRGRNVSLGNALITDDRLNALLSHALLAYNSESLNFDDLPIPFRCVATDLTSLRPAVFADGSLPFAVRASISIPGVFQPVRRNGEILVDGAIVDNLPTDVLRRDLHADLVIAVHLSDSSFAAKDAGSMFGIFARAFQAGTNRNEELSRAQADLEILPAVSMYSSTDYGKSDALVRAGYAAAEAQRQKLLTYALNEDDWKSYQASLEARRRPLPGRIRAVRVEGPGTAVSALLARGKEKLIDQPFDARTAETLVSNSSVDEYRGTDVALSRAIYLRRVASLPTGLGQGVYLTGGYEAGAVWSPETRAFLRQDVFGGVLLSTPLGAITAAGAVGNAGRRRVFFTFGKLF